MKMLLMIGLGLGAAFAQESLVGRWRSAETSKGGIGAMYDFAEDGTVQFSPGAIVPMQYRVDGDRLTTYPVDEAPFRLAWKDDNHLSLSVKGGKEDLVRLGAEPDANNKITGEWTGKRSMDGRTVVVHWIFNADGSLLLMIRFLTLQGRYELHDGRLSATFGSRDALSGAITVADGTLTIDRGNGKVTRLQRY